MAKRCWVVFCEEGMSQDREWGGKYNNTQDKLSVFFRLRDAEEYASMLASKTTGKDVYIMEQSHGYYCNPVNPIKKVWNAEGQYIPVTT